MGDPDEIAKAISFLAPDEASYVIGIQLSGVLAAIELEKVKKGPLALASEHRAAFQSS
jgi:NAD(P)-dependent dehydrogenase (short-subunit alcohol dehydrogenase family)